MSVKFCILLQRYCLFRLDVIFFSFFSSCCNDNSRFLRQPAETGTEFVAKLSPVYLMRSNLFAFTKNKARLKEVHASAVVLWSYREVQPPDASAFCFNQQFVEVMLRDVEAVEHQGGIADGLLRTDAADIYRTAGGVVARRRTTNGIRALSSLLVPHTTSFFYFLILSFFQFSIFVTPGDSYHVPVCADGSEWHWVTPGDCCHVPSEEAEMRHGVTVPSVSHGPPGPNPSAERLAEF